VMDTTDPRISFDEKGVCNHCKEFDEVTTKRWFPNDEGQKRLQKILDKIKKEGKDQEYDCIMGLSGGVDSSYLAMIVHEYGLRPLVVHVDAGWNSELATHNIEKIVTKFGFDLHTHVMDWEEIRDLQVAYLKAGVANQDVVQDHAFFSSLYHFATENKIKYVINGSNIATESVFPSAWHHSAMDSVNLRAIHKHFGTIKLKQFKPISFWHYYLYYPYIKGMTVVKPLNYLNYNKAEALKELKSVIGYKEYGRKHGESRFTKFFQNYYLPTKFGMDKRRPHLSSEILSGLITRAEAIEELQKSLCDPVELDEDLSYIAKKLRLSKEELRSLIESPGKSYAEFANWDRRYNTMKKIQTYLQTIVGIRVKTHSTL